VSQGELLAVINLYGIWSSEVKAKAILLLPVLVLLSYIGFLLSCNTIAIVKENNLLPLWDQAAHSVEGWEIYFYLRSMNLPMFVWKLWTRGLWPFVNNLYLTIFYFICGPYYYSALISNVVAFIGIGCLSSYILIKLSTNIPIFSMSLMLLFLISSPMYLAFASLSMLETFGSLMQLLVFISYIFLDERRDNKSATIFACSLTILFFTKFNYFFMVFIPILIHEYFIFTSNFTLREHWRNFLKNTKLLLSYTLGKVLFLYCLIMIILIKVGGFEFSILNRKVYIGDIGGSGHVVLYILLWNLWKSYNKRKEYWKYILSLDYRIRPLIYFFGIPVLIWFAIPYPNHINDFFKFMINRKTENIDFFGGIYYYYNALRNDYFYSNSLFIVTIIIYIVSIGRYKYQESHKKWLILTSFLQILMIISHHQKQSRFLFLFPITLWLVVCIEVQYWLQRNTIIERISIVLSLLVLYYGITSSKTTMQDTRFKKFAFEQYTDNNQINDSFKWIRNSINEKYSIAILGKSDRLSPSLFYWNIGPPKGYIHYIGTVNPKQSFLLKRADYITVITPNNSKADYEITQTYQIYSDHIKYLLDNNSIVYFDEFNIDSMNLTFRLYRSLGQQ
jgi:hypothetical protein